MDTSRVKRSVKDDKYSALLQHLFDVEGVQLQVLANQVIPFYI
jgi:hypothetical protein